jgi:succinate dehydrogenase / fumarate reductase iron-sulfur subunit
MDHVDLVESMASTTQRNVRVFRYDPSLGGDGGFQDYVLECPNESAMTMLDVLLRIQREQDPTIAFRFACRVAMCGSCGMVINGKERLACKTNVSDLPPGQDITLRPMNHFPVIKDLVVDMDPMFRKFRETLSFFEPKDASPEPALIPPDAPEREEIRIATDCIACGCCVSSCTMVDHHPDYAGPAALARAYSLLADGRDGLFQERLNRALPSCHECRTEMNCTEVCPKGISPTRAIKYIERIGITRRQEKPVEPVAAPKEAPEASLPAWKRIDRATFLRHAGVAALGVAAAATVGAVAAVSAIPHDRGVSQSWIPLAQLQDLPAGRITTVMLEYDLKSGIYSQRVKTPVLVSRLGEQILCYKSACPHLGCTVRWDGPSDRFRCACHGGAFDRVGNVTAGPPARPLDQYESKVDAGMLLVLV